MNPEIQNLCRLNDYLTQTIEVLARAQRLAANTGGLSHSSYSPYYNYGYPYNYGMQPSPFGGIDPTLGGLSHSPYTVPQAPFASAINPSQGFSPFVDPFGFQRGISHSSAQFGVGWGPWSPFSPEYYARQQQQLAHAMLARQQAYDVICRSAV